MVAVEADRRDSRLVTHDVPASHTSVALRVLVNLFTIILRKTEAVEAMKIDLNFKLIFYHLCHL